MRPGIGEQLEAVGMDVFVAMRIVEMCIRDSGNAERNAAGSGPNDREYAGDIERQAAHAAAEGRWGAVLSDGSAGVFESGF